MTRGFKDSHGKFRPTGSGRPNRAPQSRRGSSLSGVRRRRGQDRMFFETNDTAQVRKEAAEDLALIAAERNPVVRTIKDGYDTADALERLRTGERKPLIDKIRDR